MLKFSDPPIQQPIGDPQSLIIVREWANWLKIAFVILFAEQQSGTTGQRPTKLLYPGRPYFDTSLGANGKKIFCDKNAAGVWVDSSGNVV